MQILTIILVAAVLVALIILLARKPKSAATDDAQKFLQNDLANLRRDLSGLQNVLTKTVDDKLGKTQTSVQAQLAQSAKIVSDVSQRLTKLDETNRRVVDVAAELKTLQNVLQNPKQRGVFGEFYLGSVLENVLAPNQWKAQYKFQDGEIVDAVIFLKDKILPIDSKFSLENYNRYVESQDKTQREMFLKKVKIDLKGRIDETAKYIRPGEGTMDFAFMFIPSESLYYDLLIGNVGSAGSSRDLIEYAFRDKHVIITSPTSFMAYLETVLQGLRSLQIEEQAKQIQARVGQLGQHLRNFDVYLTKLGNSLGTTVGHFNNAHREFVKVDKDVLKIAGDNSADALEAMTIDRPSGE
ncbi:MAG: DNA recombination protein RmuC [Candidatus Nomurabacteria bacterium]|nr:DNA recombination protein RmuC [Candidatus Nomurabacteria bacterium]